MIRRKMSIAFEKWKTPAAQMQAGEMALRTALMRIVHAKLAGSMSMWREMAVMTKNQARMASGTGGEPS